MSFIKEKLCGKGIRNNYWLFLNAQIDQTHQGRDKQQISNKRMFFFLQHIIKLWNSLPQDVAEAKSVSVFKMELDTFLRAGSVGSCEKWWPDTAFGWGNPSVVNPLIIEVPWIVNCLWLIWITKRRIFF